jgi:hypothetical protein
LNGSNTVQSDDLGPGAQVKAADVAANSVNGSDIVNGSITGADIAPSALTRGRSITSQCNPTSTTFVDCGTMEINLTRPSRVLIIANATWWSDGAGGGRTDGKCQIAINSGVVGEAFFPGETQDVSDFTANHSLTLTAMTSPASLGAGFHTFGLVCNESHGDIIFGPTQVSVVLLGSA